jgi:hypothetical protein
MLHLFLRVILVCILSIMASAVAATAPMFLNPLLGALYLFAITYFFAFTCNFEGTRDRNKVETGLIRENKGKGFLCSGVLVSTMIIIGAIPTFFGTEVLFTKILSVIYYVLSMSVWNLVEIFTSGAGNSLVRFIIYAVVYLICFILGGVGYKLGYENKHPFKPIADKFSSWKN